MSKKSKKPKKGVQSIAQKTLAAEWDAIVKKWDTVPRFAGKFNSQGTTTGRLPSHQTATSNQPSGDSASREVEKMRRWVHAYGMGPSRLGELLQDKSLPSVAAVDLDKVEARVASLVTPGGVAALKPSPVYTGTKMLGVATMHKSNSVPVFSPEEAVEISKMRRG